MKFCMQQRPNALAVRRFLSGRDSRAKIEQGNFAKQWWEKTKGTENTWTPNRRSQKGGKVLVRESKQKLKKRRFCDCRWRMVHIKLRGFPIAEQDTVKYKQSTHNPRAKMELVRWAKQLSQQWKRQRPDSFTSGALQQVCANIEGIYNRKHSSSGDDITTDVWRLEICVCAVLSSVSVTNKRLKSDK